MAIVDRLNRAANHNHAIRGHRPCGFDDHRSWRIDLSDRAQAEGTSYCEQKYALQDSSYRQNSALLRYTGLGMASTVFTASALAVSMPDAELGKIVEEAEYLQEPQNHGNHYNAVQNTLDLPLHWDVAIPQP